MTIDPTSLVTVALFLVGAGGAVFMLRSRNAKELLGLQKDEIELLQSKVERMDREIVDLRQQVKILQSDFVSDIKSAVVEAVRDGH